MLEMEVTDLWEAASRVQTVDQYKHWIKSEVRLVLPHGAFACGHGQVNSAGVSMDYVLTIDYPIDYLNSIRNTSGGIDTPLMRRWFQTRKPVIFEASCPRLEVSENWLENFRKHKLINAIAHAEYDLERHIGTYFSFHCLPEPLGQAQRAILVGITPVLHETLLRVIARFESEKSTAYVGLSAREEGIARCIVLGNSNSEIAGKLKLSENTIKHHITAILRKIGCANRAELAARISANPEARSGNGTKVL